ncbi:MAG TPA: DUF1501 domain-containing protein [Gemmataceae bacterium]|nr:DUF1501 domain-containing protein [Gemmataceae bacterium]
MPIHDLFLRMTRGQLSRRAFLRTAAAGAAGVSALGWMDAVRLQAEELRKKGLSCILLFMQGGPSQFETFDPKPGASTGGPTRAIDTAVPGVQIAEHWPEMAKQMKDVALIRSMNSREGNHPRAQFLLHTGYVPSGSVKYPSFGAHVASELGSPDFDLPHFVSISGGGGGGMPPAGSGFLGMQYAPFVVQNPTRLPLNTELPRGVDEKVLKRRLGLLDDLEKDFAEAGARPKVEDHRALYGTASQMVLSPRLKAFDVAQEKDALRERYGKNNFGQACLLARRLVETGVTFVEVLHGNWDTHQDNFERTKALSAPVDRGFAALVGDLKERGLLEKTLVVWMGEFGRTPNINGRTGRDHYPRAFSVALAGCGIKGGAVIGATTKDGRNIAERPVGVPDLFCTLCKALKINPRKETLSNAIGGRPIKIVDGGQAVKELFA